MTDYKTPKSNIVLSAFLNVVRKACMIAFPLISYSYASRVLGTDGIGIYEFSQSIVNYFALIAALGISNYAVRDGAKFLKAHNENVHGQNSDLDRFVSEVFSINLLMTIIAYVLLAIVVITIPILKSYGIAIMIASVSILFTTISVDWINSLFEDYLYLTIRYIVIQIVAIAALFFFVTKPEDIYKYIAVSIMATVVNGVMNLIYIRRYVRVHFTFKLNLAKHVAPILILFCNNIASVVYLNSDVTILGILTDDNTVGLYGVASKIYIMIKELMNAAIFVMIPRFTMYVSDDDYAGGINRYEEGLKNLLLPLFVILVPACIGLGFLAENIIGIIAGKAFVDGGTSLRILAVSMFFAVMACFLAFAIVMPHKLEKYFLASTTLAAIINIVLNFVLIPKIGMDAAALTTLLAEIVVFFLLLVVSSRTVKITKLIKIRDVISVICASASVILVCSVARSWYNNKYTNEYGFGNLIFTIGTVVAAVVVYLLVIVISKNSVVENIKGVINKR